jgi:hypothetical protein
VEKELLTLADACNVLSYGKTKVRELIREGILETRGKGAGLRIVRRSIDNYVNGEASCRESHDAAPRAQVRSGKTRRDATTGGSPAPASDTRWSTRIPTGQKLDLMI